MLMEENRKARQGTIWGVSLFCVLVLSFSTMMNIKTSNDMQGIMEDSIRSQLISICMAAQEVISEYPFASYDSLKAVEADYRSYTDLRWELRKLADDTGAKYIYVLRYIDGQYLFVLDTDPEDEQIFVPYEPSQVHLDAFNGKDSAGVNNVTDEYGTFHSGAVPIIIGGRVEGVVSVDIEDIHYQESMDAARRNNILLVTVLAGTMILMLVYVSLLMRRLHGLQDQMERMAHYDAVTGLPNRQYLMQSLATLTQSGKSEPFALFFIDMDNFKAVNDNAGHDAGDELLRYMATFLEERNGPDGQSFRPSAGILNVSARIGGDEFIQIVSGVKDEEQAGKIAEELVESFAGGNYNRYIEKYGVGLSVGVALFPYHTDNYNVLIKYADIAMYHAKHAGKNSWRIYSDDMAPKDEK